MPTTPRPSPRPARTRLSVAQAGEEFGADVIRRLAPTRQAFGQWKERGVPWEIVGPLLMAQLSRAASSRPEREGQKDVEMHQIEEAQGRVFQLARRYGVRSVEFQILMQMLTAYVPELVPVRAHAGPPSHTAGVHSVGPAPRRRGTRG